MDVTFLLENGASLLDLIRNDSCENLLKSATTLTDLGIVLFGIKGMPALLPCALGRLNSRRTVMCNAGSCF